MVFSPFITLALALVLLNSCGGSSESMVARSLPSPSVQKMERNVAASIDRERAKQGYKGLIFDARIAALARKHSQYLVNRAAKKGKLELNHHGVGGRINTIILDYAMSQVAENVAYVEPNARAPVARFTSMWVASSKHYENMMQDWNYTGVGIYHSADGAIFVTQIFALKTDYTF